MIGKDIIGGNKIMIHLKFVKTQAKQSLYCPECDENIYKCDRCGEYFELGESVYCGDCLSAYHLCEACAKEK